MQLLSSHGSTARILAGGQSLLPLLSFRLVQTDVLIDLKSVPGLDYVSHEDGSVRIGALTRHRTVEHAQALISKCQMIGDAMAVLGHVAIRNQGTVGGSLAHADPAAEWPALALALEGQMTVLGPKGFRSMSADGFFEGYMTTALEPDEMLTELKLRLPGPGSGSSFQELAYRHGDFAQAGAGAVLTVVDGTIEVARVVLLGVGPTPLRATAVEDALIGRQPDPTLFERACKLAHDVMEPFGDVHASADYKRHVATVMLRRALEIAYQRSSGLA